MTNEFKPGDRVTWTKRGELRTGTVEVCVSWTAQARVKPDKGNRQWVSKDKLTKVEQVQP